MTQRKWLPLVGFVLLTAALGWWVFEVALLDPVDRSTASGYGQFVLAAVGLPISLVALWRAAAGSPVPDLDEVTDQLALAMRSQGEATAVERRLIQPAPLPIRWRRAGGGLAGPVSAATDGQHWFDPLPGLTRVTVDHISSGTRQNLHAIYGGLPSGRLMIVGGPGAGKSSAAVLLMLDALRYREQATSDVHRRQIPVPVMFTLRSWDPNTTSLRDWLTAKLTDLPPLRGWTRLAGKLLDAGRIAVFLDGLDEIVEQVRPRALLALSEQATFRLVLLTRSAELAEAVRHHGLYSAVALELQALPPDTVAEYLLRPLTDPAPDSWRRVATTVTSRPGSPLGRSLVTPLWVSLVHDVYHPTGPVGELLDETRFPTPKAITDHLLDRAVTAAYSPRPGRPVPRYSAYRARRALTLIARRLNAQTTRDLAWWDIPRWIPASVRILLSTLFGGALFAVVFGVALSTLFGTVVALRGGLVVGGVLGSVFGLAITIVGARPPAKVRLSFGSVFSLAGARYRLGAGLSSGFAVYWLEGAPKGVITLILVTLLSGFITPSNGTGEPADPVQTWRRERALWLVFWLTLGATLDLMFDSPVMLVAVSCMFLSLAVMGLQSWQTALTQVYLAIRHGTPLRLVRFLEDARERHLLRTVGPVYQFRHATLQDRLAEKG
ncbi:hypothetical protein ACIGNX_13985 [Actinosynnema sp. NPDC053489]|uniref:hypothetical protein n=1 Tax=Actinosynnema sp. NPDC053489 TaxID=3363916 RepID=UPI0037CBF1B6